MYTIFLFLKFLSIFTSFVYSAILSGLIFVFYFELFYVILIVSIIFMRILALFLSSLMFLYLSFCHAYSLYNIFSTPSAYHGRLSSFFLPHSLRLFLFYSIATFIFISLLHFLFYNFFHNNIFQFLL